MSMTTDQIWAIICFILSGCFALMAALFAILKEKGAVLMAGFNDFSKEKRELYDKKRISADARNMLFLWAAVLLVGGLLSYFISFYCGISAGVIWLILCFKELKFNADKAFEKYKL